MGHDGPLSALLREFDDFVIHRWNGLVAFTPSFSDNCIAATEPESGLAAESGFTSGRRVADRVGGFAAYAFASRVRARGEGVSGVLGDEVFARAYRLRFGNLEGIEETAAFVYGRQIYLRRGSQTFLPDAVHEGTHALDFTRGFQGSTLQWEYRAWSAERDYRYRLGLPSPFRDAGFPLGIPSRADYLRMIYDRYGP